MPAAVADAMGNLRVSVDADRLIVATKTINATEKAMTTT